MAPRLRGILALILGLPLAVIFLCLGMLSLGRVEPIIWVLNLLGAEVNYDGSKTFALSQAQMISMIVLSWALFATSVGLIYVGLYQLKTNQQATPRQMRWLRITGFIGLLAAAAFIFASGGRVRFVRF